MEIIDQINTIFKESLNEGVGEDIYDSSFEFAKKIILKSIEKHKPYASKTVRDSLVLKFGLEKAEAEGIIHDVAQELELGQEPNFE